MLLQRSALALLLLAGGARSVAGGARSGVTALDSLPGQPELAPWGSVGFSRKFHPSGADQKDRYYVYLSSCDESLAQCPPRDERAALARAWATQLRAPEIAMRWLDVIDAKLRSDATWDSPFAIGVADAAAKLYVQEALPDLPVALGGKQPQFLGDHLRSMDGCVSHNCTVEVVSIEWRVDEIGAVSPTGLVSPTGVVSPDDTSAHNDAGRPVALRYYSHQGGHPTGPIEDLHWPPTLKLRLREAVARLSSVDARVHDMWRSPTYYPRTSERAPLMTPTTAMIYFADADEAAGFAHARELLSHLMSNNAALIDRYDQWSAQAVATMHERDEMAQAILQLSPDDDDGFVAAAYADPRKRGIRPRGFYIDHRRKLRNDDQVEACVDLDCVIRYEDGVFTEHCKEPETEFTLCQQRLAMNAGRNSSGTVARTRALPLLRP